MESTIAYIFVVVGTILVSMTLHEAMHAFVGYWLGDSTAKDQGRLTLNPIKHIDPFLTILLPLLLAISGAPIFGGARPVPFNPGNLRGGEWGTALVAVAGPLTNLLIACLLFGVLAIFQPTGFLQYVLAIGFSVNLGFFAFNMLPIPPLDGSRVLYALAPDFVRRGMEYIERFGIVIVFLLVLLAAPFLGTILQAITHGVTQLLTVVFGV